jgi:hypothetical protein
VVTVGIRVTAAASANSFRGEGTLGWGFESSGLVQVQRSRYFRRVVHTKEARRIARVALSAQAAGRPVVEPVSGIGRHSGVLTVGARSGKGLGEYELTNVAEFQRKPFMTLEVDVAGFPLCRVPHVSGYWPNAPSLRGVQSTHVEYAGETGRPCAERA